MTEPEPTPETQPMFRSWWPTLGLRGAFHTIFNLIVALLLCCVFLWIFAWMSYWAQEWFTFVKWPRR